MMNLLGKELEKELGVRENTNKLRVGEINSGRKFYISKLDNIIQL